MADFRKSLLTLVGTLTLGAVAASAQVAPALSCVLSGGGNPLARSEGITEITGDIVIQCTGGTPTPNGQLVPQVNIRIFLNTSVTSRIVQTTNNLSEALLLLDEPTNNPLNPTFFPCATAPVPCPATGNGAGLPLYNGNKNVFQGAIASSNSVEWLGIPVDPPGTSGTRTIRITNIRANANALGGGSTSGIPVGIVAVITSSNSQTLPIQTPSLTIASILKSLDFTVGSPAVKSLQQCFSQSNTLVGTLNYKELFATAFRKYNVGSGETSPATPTTKVNQTTYQVGQNSQPNAISTETVFYQSSFPSPINTALGSAGLPDFGTRLKAVFNNIPSGVSLSVGLVPSAVTQVGSTTPLEAARLVTSESGAYAAASSGAVSLTGGTGQAVWEVTEANGSATTTLTFQVFASYTADPGNNKPALGTGTVSGSYAPTSTATTATTGPVPRFADTGDARNLLTIVPCVTNLLFPFVTNQVGFDTGLAISSTSTDPFGTSPQSGICKLYWYGANAPAVTDTPVVQSGTSWVGLTSSLAPNFQGYMIAVCRFQYAHGFAFVSDFGADNIAMGYLALVIPDPATPRHAAPNHCSGSGTASLTLSGCVFSGEQLTN